MHLHVTATTNILMHCSGALLKGSLAPCKGQLKGGQVQLQIIVLPVLINQIEDYH